MKSPLTRQGGLPLGDGVLILAMLAWLTVAVGPWWLGVALFVLAWLLNLLHRLVIVPWLDRRIGRSLLQVFGKGKP